MHQCQAKAVVASICLAYHLFAEAAPGFFLILDMWVVDLENKIVTYPNNRLKEVRTFHWDDFLVLYSKVGIPI